MTPQRRPRELSSVWKYVALIAAVLVVGVLVVAALVRPTSTPMGDESAAPAPTEALTQPVPEPDAEDVVVVGDSNTVADSPDFNEGQIGDESWVSALLDDQYQFAGGWARGGSTSIQQAEGVSVVEGAEVLLVMTGTNDLSQGVPFDQTAASLDEIAEKAAAERVVLLAIPPRDEETTPSSVEFNQDLQALAEDRGWDYFDGLEFLRSSDGGFVEATTTDGVHLTPDAQQQFGETVAEYLDR